MKGWLVALGIFAGLVIAGIVFFWLNFYTIHVRYRLTVEVQDGNQIKTGSSVIDVSYNMAPDNSPGVPSTFPRTVGYAPTVDLGEKGMLFLTFVNATRTSAQNVERNGKVLCPFNDIGCLPFAAYDKPGKNMGSSAYSQRKVALDQLLHQNGPGPRDVPFAVLPKLVRFLDSNDPRALAPVSPVDLAASFGPGVELKRVILQLTDDPVTPPPEIWPQWMKVKGNAEFRGYENG